MKKSVNRLKNATKHNSDIFVFVGVLLGVFVLKLLGINCVIYEIFGFRCPTCGMTRALVSLARLDFSGYLFHNAFALPVLVAFLLLVFNKRVEKHRKVWMAAAFVILAANLVYYLTRII